MDDPAVVTVVDVKGISGAWGRQLIADTLTAIPGVHSVRVNLQRGKAAVLHEASCRSADLAGALTNLGIRAGPFTRQEGSTINDLEEESDR